MKTIKDKYLLVGADFAGYPLKKTWLPSPYCGNFENIIFKNIDLRPLEPNYPRPPFLF